MTLTIAESLSVVLPAKNEAENLSRLIPKLKNSLEQLKGRKPREIIVVNDGSDDDTEQVCLSMGIKVVSHPYSLGNGAAIKTGTRNAMGEIIVFMDADGQHDPDDLPRLLEKLYQGYDMAVGARNYAGQASNARFFANLAYNRLASIMTSFKIDDLTSGFRAVRSRHFKKFLYLLPNGFSYPTTCTMAFFRSGLPVAYVPIKAHKRQGKSKIRVLKDGFRFFIIIIKIGALFSPMRLFLPISGLLFFMGMLYYAYTFMAYHRFTNMSALLLTSSLLVFLIGLLSEQISALHYKSSTTETDIRRTKREPKRE